jgi:para-nitrobenzyl esterase
MESTLTSVAKDEEIVGPVVHTALGDLRGFLRDGIAAFYGVPYAAPPVGDLRFAPAVPVGSWSGLRDAT